MGKRKVQAWAWKAMVSLVLIAAFSPQGQAFAQDRTASASPMAAEKSEDAPTYAKDVAPILQQNCVVCHRPGAIGPMSLLTFENAKQYAPLIKYRVENRIMPPPPPPVVNVAEGTVEVRGFWGFRSIVLLGANKEFEVNPWSFARTLVKFEGHLVKVRGDITDTGSGTAKIDADELLSPTRRDVSDI